MPTSSMPEHLTKVSFILPKPKKLKLERIAKRSGRSMSAVISEALEGHYEEFQPRRRAMGAGRK